MRAGLLSHITLTSVLSSGELPIPHCCHKSFHLSAAELLQAPLFRGPFKRRYPQYPPTAGLLPQLPSPGHLIPQAQCWPPLEVDSRGPSGTGNLGIAVSPSQHPISYPSSSTYEVLTCLPRSVAPGLSSCLSSTPTHKYTLAEILLSGPQAHPSWYCPDNGGGCPRTLKDVKLPLPGKRGREVSV